MTPIARIPDPSVALHRQLGERLVDARATIARLEGTLRHIDALRVSLREAGVTVDVDLDVRFDVEERTPDPINLDEFRETLTNGGYVNSQEFCDTVLALIDAVEAAYEYRLYSTSSAYGERGFRALERLTKSLWRFDSKAS